jgi:hypothetical protein
MTVGVENYGLRMWISKGETGYQEVSFLLSLNFGIFLVSIFIHFLLTLHWQLIYVHIFTGVTSIENGCGTYGTYMKLNSSNVATEFGQKNHVTISVR